MIDRESTMIDSLKKPWFMIVLGVMAVLLIVLVVRFWPAKQDDHADYVACLALYSELKVLRDKKASDAEWNEFEERASRQMESMKARLQETAGPHAPVRQHLFWAAEIFTEMLPKSRKRTTPQEKRFQREINAVENRLAGKTPVFKEADESGGTQYDPYKFE